MALLLIFVITTSQGCYFAPRTNKSSDVNSQSVCQNKTSKAKQSVTSIARKSEKGLSTNAEQNNEALTEATISADFSKLLKLLKSRFQDLTSIRTGVAGCSLSNSAIAATWLNDLCSQELDYKLVAKQFTLYLQTNNSNDSDEQGIHLPIKKAWQILAELGDKLINKDESVLACVKDAGASFKIEAVKSECWKNLKKCINIVISEVNQN